MTEVQGLNKWERQIKRIPVSALQVLKDSQGKNAEKLAASIRAFVPRGKTNRLFKSVNWRRGQPPAGSILRQRILTDRQLALLDSDLLVTVYAGNDAAYYARFVEFGTKAHASRAFKQQRWEKAAGRVARMKRGHAATRPRPFFYPVIRAYKNKIKRSTASAANRGIKKAVTG